MPSKEELIRQFDANGPGIAGKLFGLPFTVHEAELVIVPIPWEVTVSQNEGTSDGPAKILEVSSQIDLFSKEIEDVWKLGVAMLDIPTAIKEENTKLRKLAAQHIEALAHRGDEANKILPSKINEASESLLVYIKHTTQELLKKGKMVAVLGGDHSVPLGFLKALSEKYYQFGILQIDAHADLRKGYEDFTYSHASIMFNALKLKSITKLVQVGIRDYCEQEYSLIQSTDRIKTFFDADIKADEYKGKPWEATCKNIVAELPDLVYLSVDIDGLDPKLCPNTGTPVPGGLELAQVVYLLKILVQSGKKIIGFDLCEVSGKTEWDAQVGARVLFELCNWMAVSQGKLRVK
jgi:agmatinase